MTSKHNTIVRVRALAALVLAIMGLVALTSPTTPAARAAAGPTVLPGEPTWNGVPAFDFGANDGVNWDTEFNMDQGADAAPIQAALKNGGMPIIRAWFFQHSLVDGHAMTDAEQLQKLQAVQNSGAVCFANFPTGNSVAYDLHLLSILGGACPYIEVMNEPEIEGVSVAQYLAFWDSFVPQARAIAPGVKIGGPATYDNQGNECTYYNDGSYACSLLKTMQGMKSAGILPDFVTYHWYPCWNDTATSCLAQAGSFASAAQQVIDWANQVFGPGMPVILSEWNADPGNPTYMNDRTWDAQFVVAALKSIEGSGLAGAMEYDISEYGNYGADDLFNIYAGGAPYATWTAFAGEIARVRNGGGSNPPPPPPPNPTPTPTQPPAPTPTPTQPPTPTPTPTPPPPPPTGGAFSDGFEGGNVGAWTWHAAAGSNTLQVQSIDAYAGAYALEMVKKPNQGNVYVEADLSHGVTTTNVAFAMKLSAPSGRGMLQLLQMTTSRGYFGGSLWLTYNAATGYTELDVYDAAYHWHTCALPKSFMGAWHTYALAYTLATGTKGAFSLTIDGSLACQASAIATTRVANDTISAYQFGSIDSDASTGMDIRLDAVNIH